MILRWLELTDFRSYPRLRWGPDPGVNLLIGPNGAGKTNALEAVAYLATLRSFRGVSDDGLIADSTDRGYVRGGVERLEGRLEGRIEIELIRSGPRRTQIDGQRLRRISDLVEVLRVVTFLPDDLDIVKRGPSRRRELLDEATTQLRPAAAADFSEYDRALRQRNAFLKSGSSDEVTLRIWDERLSQAGGKVMARRATTMTELAPYIAESYRAVGGAEADLEIVYGSEWGGLGDATLGASTHAGLLSEALASRRRHDLERRVTSMGPHRDDPAVVLDGHDVRVHGSQGEQRTTALALRLATHRAVTERTGVSPVLLLDDVFSELDEGRAERLAASLPPAQTLISSARPEDVPIRGRRWRVGTGELVEDP